jgi:hypothetical protein
MLIPELSFGKTDRNQLSDRSLFWVFQRCMLRRIETAGLKLPALYRPGG